MDPNYWNKGPWRQCCEIWGWKYNSMEKFGGAVVIILLIQMSMMFFNFKNRRLRTSCVASLRTTMESFMFQELQRHSGDILSAFGSIFDDETNTQIKGVPGGSKAKAFNECLHYFEQVHDVFLSMVAIKSEVGTRFKVYISSTNMQPVASGVPKIPPDAVSMRCSVRSAEDPTVEADDSEPS